MWYLYVVELDCLYLSCRNILTGLNNFYKDTIYIYIYIYKSDTILETLYDNYDQCCGSGSVSISEPNPDQKGQAISDFFFVLFVLNLHRGHGTNIRW